MRFFITLVIFFTSIITLSAQIQHRDSIVTEADKTFNYNIFQFYKTKIVVALREADTFTKKEDNFYEFFSADSTAMIGVYLVERKGGYNLDQEKLAAISEQVEEQEKKEKDFLGHSSKIININGYDAIHSAIIHKEEKGYAISSRYSFFLNNGLFVIGYITKTIDKEGAEKFIKETLPKFQEMVNSNIFIIES